MSISDGICATYFVLSIIVFIFLSFQINEMHNRDLDFKHKDEDDLMRASKLTLQSATQTHPLFAHDHALEAKLILDKVMGQYGGSVTQTEKVLKMSKGHIENIKAQIYTQYEYTRNYMIGKIIEVHPELDSEIDLTKLSRHSKARKNKN
jgi:hypothetical protein